MCGAPCAPSTSEQRAGGVRDVGDLAHRVIVPTAFEM
jgi:hypothetical protein